MDKTKTVFETLNAINVNDHVEKKNGLTYLSWAWAWATVKKAYPSANYKVFEQDRELGKINYFEDGQTAYVHTSVTIEGETIEQMLPIMDSRNKSIPVANITSFNVNTAIQRCITKNLAMFGLGLYIYAGEDLPEDAEPEPAKDNAEALALLKPNQIEWLVKNQKYTDKTQITMNDAKALLRKIEEKKKAEQNG